MQSLWIGKPLSKLEQLCFKSFLDNGHTVHLYVYDNISNVPSGVIIKDANEILDKSEIYRYKNGSVSAFSNLFRFTLLYKKGGYWIDADLLCVRPIKLNQDYVFSSEPDEEYKITRINAGLIKLPKGSKEALLGMQMSKAQEELILRLPSKEIILCLDNDVAGKKGRDYTLTRLSNRVNISYLKLPNQYKDVQEVKNYDTIKETIKNRRIW